ncbi:Transposase [Caenorhabditis elegans]|uniref:Transposase n=1 Tax=Caenorhabditis elegans TaxID=6239 RepID=I2HAD8_CAEEL|nr:Transposase [Caenorhabditis elegans]CCH63845.1 Transposase [Caenorhabditis elegans]|eukprot:NP_001255133.1 Uncharacterized protein CELE_Y66D12A.30 [Caenorhabditis elegans]
MLAWSMFHILAPIIQLFVMSSKGETVVEKFEKPPAIAASHGPTTRRSRRKLIAEAEFQSKIQNLEDVIARIKSRSVVEAVATGRNL